MKFITRSSFLKGIGETNMCEFNIILNGKIVFKDVIYARADSKNVVVRNVLGESRDFKDCKIVEIDVNATRLVLSSSI